MTRRLALVLLAAGLVSCRHLAPSSPSPAADLQIFVETGNGPSEPLELPQSGVRIAAEPKPALTANDIASVDLAQAEFGPCLVFQTTREGTAVLEKLAGEARGRRLVLVVNGRALGARRIDTSFADGRLFFFVEVPAADVAQLVTDLKAGLPARRSMFPHRL